MAMEESTGSDAVDPSIPDPFENFLRVLGGDHQPPPKKQRRSRLVSFSALCTHFKSSLVPRCRRKGLATVYGCNVTANAQALNTDLCT